MKKILLLILSISLFCFAAYSQDYSSEQVPEVKLAEKVKIYPNPVINQELNIKSGEAFIKIEIVNVVGQTIQTVVNEESAHEMNIKLNNVERGLYIVKIIFPEKKAVIKKILVKD